MRSSAAKRSQRSQRSPRPVAGRTRRATKRAHGHAVGEAEAREPGAKRGVAPVVGVDHDAGVRKSGLQYRAHLRQGDQPLLATACGGRNARDGATAGVVGPRGREVEVEGQRPRAPVGDQRTRHGDLAIADLPQGASVLPLHAHRLPALFRTAGVVDRADARPDRHHGAQVCPDVRRVPR